MKLVNRANLSTTALAAVDATLPCVATLFGLFAWARGQSIRLVSAVTQDEFTHDLVFAWSDGLYLVYGAT